MAIAWLSALLLGCGGAEEPAEPQTNEPSAPNESSTHVVRDDFDGTLSLDWEVIRPDETHVSLEKKPGHLVITTQAGDIWGEWNVGRNIHLVNNPFPDDSSFVVTTKLSFAPTAGNHQAGPVIMVDEDEYLTFAYKYQSSVGVTIRREIDAQPIEYALPRVLNRPTWLRITKRRNEYEFAHSEDGEAYTVVGRLPWGDGRVAKLGLYAVNGGGRGTSAEEIDAAFDYFEVRRIDKISDGGLKTAPTESKIVRDDFEQETSLDWTVDRPDPSHVSLERRPGALTITTQYGGGRTGKTARNVHFTANPFWMDDDFSIRTRIDDLRPTTDWQQCGIVVSQNDEYLLRFVFENGKFAAIGSKGGQPVLLRTWPFRDPPEQVYLQLTKRRDQYTCSISTDGDRFTTLGTFEWLDVVSRMGLIAMNGGNREAAEIDASFDFFEVEHLGSPRVMMPLDAVETKPEPEPTDVVPEGLVAHLRFDGVDGNFVKDSVSGRPVGRVSSSPRSLPGVRGQAILLDENATVDVGQLFVPKRDEPFSVSLWAQGRPAGKWPNLLVKAKEKAGFKLDLDTDLRATFHLISESGYASAGTAVPTLQTKWTHIVLTYDGSGSGSGMHVYVNGELAQTGRAKEINSVLENDATLRIGSGFTGAIDELRFYDRELDPAEVGELAAEGGIVPRAARPPKPDPTKLVPQGLVAHFRLDELVEAQIKDSVSGKWTGRASSAGARRVAGAHDVAIGVEEKTHLELGQVLQPARSKPFTLSLWTRCSGVGKYPRLITTEPGGVILTFRGEGKLKFVIVDVSGWKSVDFAAPDIADEWTHLTMTYDGSGRGDGICIYVNGTQVRRGSAEKSIETIDAKGKLRLGGGVACTLDDCRIYDRALTADEVAELFAAVSEDDRRADAGPRLGPPRVFSERPSVPFERIEVIRRPNPQPGTVEAAKALESRGFRLERDEDGQVVAVEPKSESPLDLVGRPTTNHDLQLISSIPTIRRVRITGKVPSLSFGLEPDPPEDSSPLADDVGIVHLTRLPNLEEFHVTVPIRALSDRSLQSLAKCRRLRVLSFQMKNGGFEGSAFTDDGLRYLSRLTDLSELGLGGCKAITGSGLRHLREASGLEQLDLAGTSFADQHAVSLLHFGGLTRMSLSSTKITDDVLPLLGELRKLQELDLASTAVTGAKLPRVATLGKLRSLNLHGTKVTDEALVHLAGMTELEELKLHQTPVTSAGAKHFANLKKLKALPVSNGQVDDRVLEFAGEMTGLERLHLLGSPISDAGLAHVAELPRIDSVNLNDTAVTDAGLEHVARMRTLRVLWLHDTAVTSSGVANLRELPKLEQLWLNSPKIGDEALDDIATMKSLKLVSLRGTGVTEAGASMLRNKRPELKVLTDPFVSGSLDSPPEADVPREDPPKPPRRRDPTESAEKELERLGARFADADVPLLAYSPQVPEKPILGVCLGGEEFTDEDLERLHEIESLKTVLLDVTSVTDEGFEHLAKIKDLEGVWISSGFFGEITESALEHLGKSKNLRRLMVYGLPVTDRGIEHLQALDGIERLAFDEAGITDAGLAVIGRMEQLELLDISGSKITDEGMQNLASLEKLEMLHIHNTSIGDAGVRHLTKMEKLKRLGLINTKIGDEGLKTLAELPALESLSLGGSAVGDEGLKHLVGLSSLRSVDLGRTAITDDAVGSLTKLKQLQSINVRDTKITAAGVDELRRALPTCRIFTDHPSRPSPVDVPRLRSQR